MITETGFAKINLGLHVTGQRDDGYHTLESIVVFGDYGDVIKLSPADHDQFSISGPCSDALANCADTDNLVIQARDQLRQVAMAHEIDTPYVDIHLVKNLPVASGLGGGSADAAATLRGLMQFWNFTPEQPQLSKLALSLGADVPMCLYSKPLIARGIGEDIELLPSVRPCGILLANPMIAVSTPRVFTALETKQNAPLPIFDPSKSLSCNDLVHFTRNDLQAPAQNLFPDIEACISALEETNCLSARMSGSGASCFALYEDYHHAELAMAIVKAHYPNWFLKATTLRST